jgi:peptidoglycan/xylan/chitin deacetylase (PgdA/CDA1 family)
MFAMNSLERLRLVMLTAGVLTFQSLIELPIVLAGVQLLSPAGGSTVGGIVPVTATWSTTPDKPVTLLLFGYRYQLGPYVYSGSFGPYRWIPANVFSGTETVSFDTTYLPEYLPDPIPVTIIVTAWYSWGVVAGSDAADISVHNPRPVINITSPADGAVISKATTTTLPVTVEFHNVEPNYHGIKWIGLSISGWGGGGLYVPGYPTSGSYTWYLNIANYPLGEYRLQAYCLDTSEKDTSTTINITIVADLPPIPSFTYSPERPKVRDPITFDGSGSRDPDGTIVKYAWGFGDGKTTEGKVVTHAYSRAATYTITLAVTDNVGLTSSAARSLKVEAKGKEFMLTFDDGPSTATLDVLKELETCYVNANEPVRAGFFMVGDSDPQYYALLDLWPTKGSLKRYPNVARAVRDAGHLIGNHTQHHAWFALWDGWWPFWEMKVALRQKYRYLEGFVWDEIFQCSRELKNALGDASLLFRCPYLYDKDRAEVGAVADLMGLKVIGGQLVGDTWQSLTEVKENAVRALSGDSTYPVVLIMHPEIADSSGMQRPSTYGHVKEIVIYLENKGFVLAHFDPTRVRTSKPSAMFAGVAHSPVDLCIVDPDGLILGKQRREIPNGSYEECDLNGDGKVEDSFMVPESKIGPYLIKVIPEPGALPQDTYSLEVGDGESGLVLAKNTPVSMISEIPYLIQLTESGIEVTSSSVRIEPRTLNLDSQGVFTVFVQLPQGYDVRGVDVSSLTCESARALSGTVSNAAGATYVAKFKKQDLADMSNGESVMLRVTGQVAHNGALVHFEGRDAVRITGNTGKSQ